VDFSAQAALITATADLLVVRSIIGAIRAADAATARTLGTSNDRVTIDDRRHLEPTPRIEPRRVFHPTPRIEPRETIHIQSRVICDPPPPCSEPIKPIHITAPFQPPWKILPWKTPIQPRAQIKVVVHKLDIKNKGSLIDVFI